MNSRKLKKEVEKILIEESVDTGIEKLHQFESRQVVNPLISMFYHRDEMVKWRAITAVGHIVSDLAAEDPESSRVIMRRLIWNLNDESGGIGWGSPEAMGESMAGSERLAEEYHKILISYIDPEGNFLEHEGLQCGALWGVGRLSHAKTEFCIRASGLLVPFMSSRDPQIRGLSVWAASPLKDPDLKRSFGKLIEDHRTVKIFMNRSLQEKTVAKLAENAISKIDEHPDPS